MWRLPVARSGGLTVTARRVIVTTLLNPKALIFGLVLLPAEAGAKLLANFGLFAGLIAAAAAGWIALGAVLARGGRSESGLPSAWRRAASVWLGALAVYLFGHAVGLA
jgi:threonine/homoserine/homoserine lactone efflux protein